MPYPIRGGQSRTEKVAACRPHCLCLSLPASLHDSLTALLAHSLAAFPLAACLCHYLSYFLPPSLLVFICLFLSLQLSVTLSLSLSLPIWLTDVSLSACLCPCYMSLSLRPSLPVSLTHLPPHTACLSHSLSVTLTACHRDCLSPSLSLLLHFFLLPVSLTACLPHCLSLSLPVSLTACAVFGEASPAEWWSTAEAELTAPRPPGTWVRPACPHHVAACQHPAALTNG